MSEKMTTIVTENGGAVLNGPLTTTATKSVTPELLKNELDKRIVKIRPMSTPIDQISRMGGTRKAGSMVVDYYSVDTKPMSAKLVSSSESGQYSGRVCFILQTENNKIF